MGKIEYNQQAEDKGYSDVPCVGKQSQVRTILQLTRLYWPTLAHLAAVMAHQGTTLLGGLVLCNKRLTYKMLEAML